jgi:uncharacterized tellurite resistance protein B-like protein
MPAKNTFGEDRIAMADAFFASQDQALVKRLREKAQRQATVTELKNATNITDERLLQTLVDLEINAETVTALGMIPLIAVAWADGKLDDSERQAILRAASEHGIQAPTDEFALLERWLEHTPGPDLLDTWKAYTRDIASQLDEAQRKTLCANLLQSAQEIAEAAGGFLGLTSPVSREERAMLDALAATFDVR